jgi:hypothetical protein
MYETSPKETRRCLRCGKFFETPKIFGHRRVCTPCFDKKTPRHLIEDVEDWKYDAVKCHNRLYRVEKEMGRKINKMPDGTNKNRLLGVFTKVQRSRISASDAYDQAVELLNKLEKEQQ